jgi:transposase-like protein
MSTSSYIYSSEHYPLTNVPVMENLLLQLTHNDLCCPFCQRKTPDVATWGSYKTKIGEVRRYYCYKCKKSFNPAKIPVIYERMGKIAFEIGKFVIKNNRSVKSLSNDLNVPESTLRTVISEIETVLVENFEYIKTLDSALKSKKTEFDKSMRILYYDEGFHRILGTQYYLIFAVDKNGIPIQAELSPSRNREDIREGLEQAITKLGGVDVIVADGSPTILSAIRGMYRSVLVVQQIHSEDGKRARIIQMDPIVGTKKMRELTIELHTESLKNNKESEFEAIIKKIYPSQRKRKLQHQQEPSLKKKQRSTKNSGSSSENNPSKFTKEELEKETESKTVNWIYTPFTNL